MIETEIHTMRSSYYFKQYIEIFQNSYYVKLFYILLIGGMIIFSKLYYCIYCEIRTMRGPPVFHFKCEL